MKILRIFLKTVHITVKLSRTVIAVMSKFSWTLFQWLFTCAKRARLVITEDKQTGPTKVGPCGLLFFIFCNGQWSWSLVRLSFCTGTVLVRSSSTLHLSRHVNSEWIWLINKTQQAMKTFWNRPLGKCQKYVMRILQYYQFSGQLQLPNYQNLLLHHEYQGERTERPANIMHVFFCKKLLYWKNLTLTSPKN